MKELKKVIAILLVFGMIFAMGGCTTTEKQQDDGNLFTAGTYTGTAKGRNDDITVEVSVDENKINSVEILEQNETENVATSALEQMPAKIVETQSLGIDAISGATITSNAIIEACKNALADACNDMDALTKPFEEESLADAEPIEKEADIVVVGAGGSGMFAAISASKSGKSVIVLEKMATVGGATAISGGTLVDTGSDFQKENNPSDSTEILKQDLLTAGHNYSDPEILDLWMNNVGETFQYFIDKGIEFKGPRHLAEHTVDRAYNAVDGTPALISAIKGDFDDSGAELMLNTKADKLIQSEDGTITGIMAYDTNNQQKYEIKADAVILATGGYGNNKELQGEQMAKTLYYGPECATGDGHIMAETVGAELRYMDFGKIYPTGIEVNGRAVSVQPATLAAYTKSSGILVNKNGERVVNEAGKLSDIRQAIWDTDEGMLYLLFDASTFADWRDQVVSTDKLLTDDQIDKWLETNGTETPLFAHGDTIEDVAEISGVNAEQLKATVDKYNGYVEKGNDEDFGRALTKPIGDGPYYIIEQKTRFATTLGGVHINTGFQVLDKNSDSVPNLYACGELVSGAHGDDTTVGTATSWAYTSGRLAGASVAEQLDNR